MGRPCLTSPIEIPLPLLNYSLCDDVGGGGQLSVVRVKGRKFIPLGPRQ